MSIVYLSINAQESATITYLPKWKKGEEKSYTIRTVQKEKKGGIIEKDTSFIKRGSIKVIGKNSDSYKLRVIIENVAYRKTVELFEKEKKELDIYKDLKLEYTVDRKTGKHELANWKEAQDFMRLSTDKYYELLGEKYPESKGIMQLAFAPLEKMLNKKESIEALFEDEVWAIFSAYDISLSPSKKVIKTNKEKNPFDETEELEVDIEYELKSINKKTNTSIIISKVEWDEEMFKTMMRTMMLEMMSSFGLEGEELEQGKKGIEEKIAALEYSRTTTNKITYDTKTTWVSKVIMKDNSIIKDGDNEGVVEVTKTFTIR